MIFFMETENNEKFKIVSLNKNENQQLQSIIKKLYEIGYYD